MSTPRDRITTFVDAYFNNTPLITEYSNEEEYYRELLFKNPTEDTFKKFYVIDTLDKFIDAIKYNHMIRVYTKVTIRTDFTYQVVFSIVTANDVFCDVIPYIMKFSLMSHTKQLYIKTVNTNAPPGIFSTRDEIITELLAIYEFNIMNKAFMVLRKTPCVADKEQITSLRNFLLENMKQRKEKCI